jgi:hypothetical protein
MDSKVIHDMFFLGLPIAEKIIRPVIVYVFLIVGLRLAGKRELRRSLPVRTRAAGSPDRG